MWSRLMKFGVMLPQTGRAVRRETVREAARRLEQLGFDSVWVGDHIIMPWRLETPYPYNSSGEFPVPPDRPFLEPLACLAFVAACTERIALGTAVLILPYRHPIYAAKVSSTIHLLSAGRLILGVGVGWLAQEFEALGANFDARGQVTDEQLEVMRRLWSEDRSGFEGQHYRFTDIAFYPKPEPPGIPIWFGGEGHRARRRAARYGDVWFPSLWQQTPDSLAGALAEVRAQAAGLGRDPFRISLAGWATIDMRPNAAGAMLAGEPEQIRMALEAYRGAGMEHAVLNFAGSYRERLAQCELFAREVAPPLRDRSRLLESSG
jgi:probable F420-dependent oxidoreductase